MGDRRHHDGEGDPPAEEHRPRVGDAVVEEQARHDLGAGEGLAVAPRGMAVAGMSREIGPAVGRQGGVRVLGPVVERHDAFRHPPEDVVVRRSRSGGGGRAAHDFNR